MPGFVKTPADEKRWSAAKSKAAEQTEVGSDSYWKLSNYIFHKMGKTEEDKTQAKLLKADLYKQAFGGMLQLKEQNMAKNPMKVGSLSVKTPKMKKLPSAFDKPSIFFKAEEFSNIKHPSVRKLYNFLSDMASNKAQRKQSI